MSGFTQDNRPLRVTTPLGPDALLLEKLTGREALSELFHFQLDLLAERPVPFEGILGQAILVRVDAPLSPTRFISGVVRRFCQGEHVAGSRGAQTFIRYRAELVPQFWRLSKRVHSRVFQRSNALEILQLLLRDEWKLNVAFEISGLREYATRNYLVQYQESDFQFASRLMEDEGLYYFFRHTDDGHHQMVIRDNSLQSVDLPVQATIAYDPVKEARKDGPRVTAWEKRQDLSSGKVTLWDYAFALPKQNLAAERASSDSVTVGTVRHPLTLAGNSNLEVFEYPGGYARRFEGVNRAGTEETRDFSSLYKDGATTARLRMEQETAGAVRVHGSGNAGHMLPGYKFSLAKHFDGDGPYVLTAVEHHASQEGVYTVDPDAIYAYSNRFECLPAELPYRPQRATPKPRIHGTETAVVVGLANDEDGIHCDKYGRVKVQFHWDRLGRDDADSSCWVRVAQTWAGKTFGAIQIPRVGQEVVVAFDHGDPDEPMIIGSLYNAENPPPYQLPDNATLSGFKTRSPGGKTGEFNGLLFDDQPGQEETMVRAQKDLLLFARDHAVVSTGGNLDYYVGGHFMEHHGKFPGTGGGGGGGDASDGSMLATYTKPWEDLKKVRAALGDARRAGQKLLTLDEAKRLVREKLGRDMTDAELADFLKDEAVVSAARRRLGREPTYQEVEGALATEVTTRQKADDTAYGEVGKAFALVQSVEERFSIAAGKPPGKWLTADELDAYKKAKEVALGRPVTPAEWAAILGRPLTYDEDVALTDAYKKKFKADDVVTASRRLAWRDYSNMDDTVTFSYAKPSLKMTASPASASASIGLSFGLSMGGGAKIDINPFSFLAQGDPKKEILAQGARTMGQGVAALLGGSLAISLGGGGSKLAIGPSMSYSRGNKYDISGTYPGETDGYKLLTNENRDIAAGIMSTLIMGSLITTQALVGWRNEKANIGLIAMNAIVGAATAAYLAFEVTTAKLVTEKFDAAKDLKKVEEEVREMNLRLDAAIYAATSVSTAAREALDGVAKPDRNAEKPDKTSSVNVVENNYALVARNLFVTSATPGQSGAAEPSCIFINARGDGVDSGTLLLRATREAALLGGPGGVFINNRGTNGRIVLDCTPKPSQEDPDKSDIELIRGKTRIMLKEGEILVETDDDSKVTVKAKKEILLHSDTKIKLQVGDNADYGLLITKSGMTFSNQFSMSFSTGRFDVIADQFTTES